MTFPVIGITGLVGSGKSTAIKHIKEKYDVHHIDLDTVGHMLLTEKEIQDRLVKEFGEKIRIDGEIHRPTLAEIVFNNQDELKTLNTIMHPAIFAKTQFLSQNYSKQKPTLIDGALMFEVNINRLCNTIICIDAPSDTIKKHISKERFKRTNFQLDKKTLHHKSDIVIPNPFTDVFYVALDQHVKRLIET